MSYSKSIRKAENDLFRVWRDRIIGLEENNRFVPDGVVDPEEYDNTSPKIVLLLKEVHEDPEEEG